MTTGLTLGKYAPLHAGHQSIIEKGIAENDHFIVIIYDSPEVTDIPLHVRSNWISTLYPTVEVIEAWDGPSEVGDSPDITKMHDEYLLKILQGKEITHFYSSEFYGGHVSAALKAKDRRVDPQRTSVPISGTEIRSNPYKSREFVHPYVYRDLVTWVCVLGAPSTGKTTLCDALAKHYKTVWMPEYGREYWENHQIERRLTMEQLVEIAEGHILREDTLVHDANTFFFIDTDASTTAHFSRYYHDGVAPELEKLANLTRERYDLCFLCEDDIPYDDTWDRSGEVNRSTMQKQIREELQASKRPFLSLKGSLEERIQTAIAALSNFSKW